MKEGEPVCPLGAKCEDVINGERIRCMWSMKLRGVNANTGEEVDEWGCAMVFNVTVALENTQMQRQTGAAVESLRNNVVKQGAALLPTAVKRIN